MGFQQGISGLNAASKNLDVIGNNIANSGTVGFKSSRAEFADLVANSMAGFSGGKTAGFGVEVATISQQFGQGGLNITGNGLDVAINGSGFFKLQLPDGTAAYTRAGNFKQDKTGAVITNDGASVMGYKVDPATGIASSTTTPLSFPIGSPIPAKLTTSVTATLNLDARANLAAGVPASAGPPVVVAIPATPRSTYGTSVNVYDTQGVATPVNLYFQKKAANEWEVFDALDDATAVPPVVATAIGTVKFDVNGVYDPANTPITLTVKPATNPNAPPVADISVALDLSGLTQFGSKFAVSDLQQDGYASGELKSINIAGDGTIMASYSNGLTRAEAQLALTNFRNPQGLTAVGSNNWVESGDSGVPIDGKPGSGSFGTLRAGALEESNVDLTAELVNMMTAQRAYQANAQTIKTQDQVMSTMVNLR
jgi:flagellar hook protein FlgE